MWVCVYVHANIKKKKNEMQVNIHDLCIFVHHIL